MLIWIVFILTYVFFAFLSVYSSNKLVRKLGVTLLILSAIYFTGFRDALGQDYHNYVRSIDYNLVLSFLEPMRAILSIIIKNTVFSYVLFFVFFATVTHFLFIRSSYFFMSSFVIILLYLFNSSLYGQSFNVVRQMFASSIFFFAFRYIVNSQKKKYLLSILLAMTSHFSSFILIPVYFYAKIQISTFFFILLYLLSLCYDFINSYIVIIISKILPLKYIGYLISYEKASFSYLILIYNILWLFCLLKRKEILKLKYGNAVFNLGFLSLFFYNISRANLIFQRLSLFFLIFLMIEFTFLAKIYRIKGDNRGLLINSLVVVVFFSIFVFSLINTPIEGLPTRILPLSSIFD